ncbi:endonuclease domain-containing protein [Pseudalkalibacillus decolorationis]|uniref:endonuclease domain-containing protein n=1 Tax=Pseudalkalibacillus decolorationis TaxID=163879 RepID=UPI002148AFBC|nr:endonuclease domain-containing protein [Pseudalkalibacillus decolorationis]
MAAWSNSEIKFLEKHYKTLQLSQIAMILRKTPRSIEQKASRLGIRKTKRWTTEDLTLLTVNYNLMSNPELADKLGRTVGSIERKARMLNLKKSKEKINSIKRKWTLEKIQFLKDNYKKVPPNEICSKLEINLGTLYRMAEYYGLREKTNSTIYHAHSSKVWNEEEISFLQEHFMKFNQQQLADSLNRTKQSIQKKMFYEGLKKYTKKPVWSNSEISYLEIHYKHGLMIQMSQHLNRTFKSIHTKANELKLNRDVSTYIEREVEEILKRYYIEYKMQVNIRGFIADFVLFNNKIIEVQGDYWHCNPCIYDGPKDEIQRNKIKQDKMKRGCFNELGYKILYIWELDLNQKYNQVVNNIKQFAVQ